MSRAYNKRWIVENCGNRVVLRWRNTRKVAHCAAKPVSITVGQDVLHVVFSPESLRGEQWFLMSALGDT